MRNELMNELKELDVKSERMNILETIEYFC